MAYVPKTQEEEDLAQQGLPRTIPGTEAGGMTPQAVPSAENKSPNKAGMSAFTDVSSYLDANKEQGQQLGQRIAQNVESTAQGAQQKVDQTAKEFQDAVSAGTMRPDQATVDAAASDPMGFLKDQQKASAFTNTAQNIYNGPSRIEELPSYADAEKQTGEAKRVLGLTSTAAGRRELLSGLEKNPTAGQTAFDELIFGMNPAAVDQVSSAAGRFGDLEGYLSGKKGEAASFADQAAADRTAARDMILNRFTGEGGAMPQIKGDVQSAVAAKRAALDSMINQYKNGGFADYNWTPEELQAAGLTEADLAGVNRYADVLRGDYGVSVNPGEYFTTSYIPEEINEANQATPEQVAKYGALSQLIGMPNDWIGEEQRAASQAPTKLGDLDLEKLLNESKGTLTTRDAEILDNLTKSMADPYYRVKSLLRDEILVSKDGRKKVIQMFIDYGLTPPDEDDINHDAQGALTHDQIIKKYSDDFKTQIIQKLMSEVSPNIVNRTKYDAPLSIARRKTAFGDGGGYGII